MGRGVVDTVLAAVFAMSIRRISQRVDPEVELEHFEVSELRQLSASLLRDRRKLLTQLQQRERSCTELLSENFELNAWQSKLLSALDRANINLEEFLKEDDRKVRMAEADKQLEAELRQMHQAVGDQQKRLDALLRENDELRQQLAAKAKDVAPRDELGVSQELPELSETPAAQPAPGNDSPGGAEPRLQRPWPLRCSVAPLRNATAVACLRPARLTVRLMPTALRKNGRAVERIEVSLKLAEPAEEVLKLLLDAGLSWPGAAQESLREGHFLLNGRPLILDLPLQDQGVQEGSELRLVKGRGGALGSPRQGAFAPRLPRGLLMSAEPWEPRTSRKAVVEFFDQVTDIDMDHMAKITRVKRGQTKPFYKTEL